MTNANLAADGVRRLHCGNQEMPAQLVHIYDDGTAAWRWHNHPFEEAGEGYPAHVCAAAPAGKL